MGWTICFCCCCLVLIVFGTIAECAGDAGFSFFNFQPGVMTLLGDAFVKNDSVQLTQYSMSSGRAIYPTTVKLADKATGSLASFKTSFTFSIINQDMVHFGDGLAFIVVPNNYTVGGPGGWIGLPNSTATLDDRLHSFAVEFDTFLNVEFMDPNDNHVGVNVNSMRSVQFADAGSASIQLKSGKRITAWIEYDSIRQELEVSLSYNSDQKPQKRLLSLSINLSGILSDNMFVGFSSATGGHVELHCIHAWSFSSALTQQPIDIPASAPVADIPTSDHLELQGKCSRKLCMLTTAKFLAISTSSSIAGAVTLCIFFWLLCSKCRVYNHLMKRSTSFKLDTAATGASMVVGAPRKFTYKELTLATKGFSPSEVLGHGAFGTVYKGGMCLHGNKVQIAVKRADRGSKHGKEEFLSELSIISRLRHRNLVQLQGWCHERSELLLVYDYMPNGSLDKLLFTNTMAVLSWSIRFKVVMGIATALAYLHSEWEQQVVHRDIKSSNIMLDTNFNARLGDFGLARLIEHDTSPETTITAGTVGYLAPEYLHIGKTTEKTDVFSFGVVSLEVATGRRPIDKDNRTVLVDWVWKLHKEGRLVEAADPRLETNFDKHQMRLLLHLGLLCSHPDPVTRPTMKCAVQILSGATSIPTLPCLQPTPSFTSNPSFTIHDILFD